MRGIQHVGAVLGMRAILLQLLEHVFSPFGSQLANLAAGGAAAAHLVHPLLVRREDAHLVRAALRSRALPLQLLQQAPQALPDQAAHGAAGAAVQQLGQRAENGAGHRLRACGGQRLRRQGPLQQPGSLWAARGQAAQQARPGRICCGEHLHQCSRTSSSHLHPAWPQSREDW